MNVPIPSFYVVDDRFATGAQPGAADFLWLREHGFSTVINLNLPSARNYLRDEAQIVTQAGMQYIDLPMDCTRLNHEQYASFRAAADAAAGKVFVHCAMNVKSTGFMHAYRVLELGHAVVEARAALKSLPELEPKWFDYFESLGAA